jgi:subtilisin-like proprotein convertase family protein
LNLTTAKLVAGGLMATWRLLRLSGTLVLSITVLALLTAPSGRADAATETFTNPTPIAIPTQGVGSPYPSQIEVGLSGAISSVSITLHGFSHTFPSDVVLLLVGPGGETFFPINRVGGGDPVSNLEITLSDDAGSQVPFTLVSGTFKPTARIGDVTTLPPPAPAGPHPTPLPVGIDTFESVFGGRNASGVWSLYAVDPFIGDGGSISGGWSITVTTASEPPPTALRPNQREVCQERGVSGSNAAPIAVPATGTAGPAFPYPSSIDVETSGTVVDVAVTIRGLSHQFGADVAILLVAPTGERLMILRNAGNGFPVSDLTITLRDDAAQFLPNSAPLASGVFKPTSYLVTFDFPSLGFVPGSGPATNATLASVFGGVAADGTWNLFVADAGSNDVGSISGGWSVELTVLECSIEQRASVGGAVAPVVAAVAQQAQENRERAAAAAAPQVPVAPPSTGTGLTVSPPNTGDAGLAATSDATAIGAVFLAGLGALVITAVRVGRMRM